MPSGRPTMAQIAARLGVSGATVSMALADDPRLPNETRERVRAMAEKLGYQRDPALASLARRRWRDQRAPESALLMAIWRENPENWTRTGQIRSAHQIWREAIRTEAQRLGYVFGETWHKAFPSAKSLTQHLQARGVSAVLVEAGRPFRSPLHLDHFYHVINVGDEQAESLNQIRFNWQAAVELAVQKIHQSGAQRWGFVFNDVINSQETREILAAVLYRGFRDKVWRTAPPVHILKHQGNSNYDAFAAREAPKLQAWVEKHRLDVVLASDVMPYHVLRGAGVRFPQDLSFVSLRRHFGVDDHAVSAIDDQGEVQGVRAVQMLHYLMQTHQRGLLPIPLIEMVKPAWHAGETLKAPGSPPRAERQGESSGS